MARKRKRGPKEAPAPIRIAEPAAAVPASRPAAVAAAPHGHGGQKAQADRQVPGVPALAVSLAALVIGSMFLMQAMLSYLSGTALGRSAAAPLPAGAGEALPDAGWRSVAYRQRLQLAGQEQSLLTTYEWIDRKAGVVRIPIDRALDLMANREMR